MVGIAVDSRISPFASWRDVIIAQCSVEGGEMVARKKNRKAPKAGLIWRMSAEEATLAGKPRNNGFALGSGPHGDVKYNRRRAESAWRKDIRSEGTILVPSSLGLLARQHMPGRQRRRSTP